MATIELTPKPAAAAARGPKDYESTVKPIWCPGCGDFAVLAALKEVFAKMALDPAKVVFASGIGCSSQISHYFSSYGMHAVHGRVLPTATGIKLANPDLTVVVAGGDGDGFAIGMGHFMHAVRRNIDLCYIVMDNQTYGLTKGQFSPTAALGYDSPTTPEGSIERPINPAILAIAGGAQYVARGFSGNPRQLSRLIYEGIEHRGFALVDVLSPCVTFNKLNTYDWFRKNVHDLDKDLSYKPDSPYKAIEMERTLGKIPLGTIYRAPDPERDKALEERLFEKVKGKPVDFPTDVQKARKEYETLLGEFR
jgi:2-oxoglutarate ferredoxin oxidoreductase subunit beta